MTDHSNRRSKNKFTYITRTEENKKQNVTGTFWIIILEHYVKRKLKFFDREPNTQNFCVECLIINFF